MGKLKQVYICQNCGHNEPKWMGQCRECGEWNSFNEELLGKKAISESSGVDLLKRTPRKVSEIQKENKQRTITGLNEFDRVVGGGLVEGSLILIGGEPGIGKSTLLMDICARLSRNNNESTILYASGEESEGQIAGRSFRLGISDEQFFIYNETDFKHIKLQLEKLSPKYLVVDSIQTIVSSDLNSAPGTVSQIREVTHEILNYCKSRGITTFIVGHVTKDGNIAGPKVLEHMVDAVIYFEGDQQGHYRILRAVKNRFGNTNEIGIFEMQESGLKEVSNPSQYFLDETVDDAFGRSISCVVEGSRTLFLEIQALVVENKYGMGRRTTQGIDSNRLAMLVAIIEKYFGIPLSASDIYANIVGGIKSKTRETDLSIVASLLSSLRKNAISEDMVFLGEVGLTGEVRSIPRMDMRLKEMEQLNYKTVVTGSRAAKEFQKITKLKLIGIHKASQLQGVLF